MKYQISLDKSFDYTETQQLRSACPNFRPKKVAVPVILYYVDTDMKGHDLYYLSH